MTTLVAVKKGKRLCIASDSLTLFGRRKEIEGKQVHGEGKIVQIGSNYVGISGHPSWDLILKHYFLQQKNIPEWKSADEVFESFSKLHQALKKTYFLASEQPKFLPFEESGFALLIINCHGIFEVEYSRQVRQYSQFSAIGSGESYALGAMRALYDELKTAEEIAKIGIDAASQFDRKSALPLHYFSIIL